MKTWVHNPVMHAVEGSQMVEYQKIAIGKLGSNTCGSGCMTSQEEEHRIIVISDLGLNPSESSCVVTEVVD